MSAAPPHVHEYGTVLQRWRFRRNLTIAVAHKAGLSQRLLADVFDLPRSSVGTIVGRFAAYTGPIPKPAVKP